MPALPDGDRDAAPGRGSAEYRRLPFVPGRAVKRRSALDRYARFLAKVSRRFARVVRRRRDAVVCRPGCFGCCVGLFEISALDAALAARGLAKLPTARREAIARRGEAIARRIAGIFPGDRSTLRLDVGREGAWNAFFEKTSGIACPFLEPTKPGSKKTAPAAARARRWPEGFTCAIYANRPHACRTFGLPLAHRGEIVSAPCPLNFRGAPMETIVALPVYEPEEDAIVHDAESQLGLAFDAATILPAVASGRYSARTGPRQALPSAVNRRK